MSLSSAFSDRYWLFSVYEPRLLDIYCSGWCRGGNGWRAEKSYTLFFALIHFLRAQPSMALVQQVALRTGKCKHLAQAGVNLFIYYFSFVHAGCHYCNCKEVLWNRNIHFVLCRNPPKASLAEFDPIILSHWEDVMLLSGHLVW